MIVEATAHGIRLIDAAELSVFSVRTDLSEEGLDTALRRCGAGRLAESYAWISRAWLIAGVADAGVKGGARGVERMASFAASRGWTAPDGAIRAHVDQMTVDGPYSDHGRDPDEFPLAH